MGVLTYDCSTIGNLECLLAYHDRVQKRSRETADKYALLLRSGQLFTPDDIRGIHGLSDHKISREKLKPCVVEWMIKYTDNAESALYVAKLAEETSKHIYKGLLKYFKITSVSEKTKMDFPILLKQVLAQSRYECLYDMLRQAKACTYLEKTKNETKMEDRKKKFNLYQPFSNETDIGAVSIFRQPDSRAQTNSEKMAHGDVLTDVRISETKKELVMPTLETKVSCTPLYFCITTDNMHPSIFKAGMYSRSVIHFSVHDIPADENSLYRSLSQSGILASRRPECIGKHEIIKQMLVDFAREEKNKPLVHQICTTGEVQPRVADEQWIDGRGGIGESKTLKGNAAMMLFAACFRIHVVNFEQIGKTNSFEMFATMHAFAPMNTITADMIDPGFFRDLPSTKDQILFVYTTKIPIENQEGTSTIRELHHSLLEIVKPSSRNTIAAGFSIELKSIEFGDNAIQEELPIDLKIKESSPRIQNEPPNKKVQYHSRTRLTSREREREAKRRKVRKIQEHKQAGTDSDDSLHESKNPSDSVELPQLEKKSQEHESENPSDFVELPQLEKKSQEHESENPSDSVELPQLEKKSQEHGSGEPPIKKGPYHSRGLTSRERETEAKKSQKLSLTKTTLPNAGTDSDDSLFKDDTSIEEECLIDERKEKSSPRIVHESENPSDTVELPQLEKKSQKLSLTKTTLPLMEECIQKTDLPAYVSIPNTAICNHFKNVPPTGRTIFEVRPIIGDGNCLYRSLCSGKLFGQKYPTYKQKHLLLRRVLADYATDVNNSAFLTRIWKAKVQKNDKDTYESWVDAIRNPPTWGGTTEMMLFASRFLIHVVSVEIVKNKVLSFATQPAFLQCKVRLTSPSDPDFYKQLPESLMNAVLLWNHSLSNPKRVRLASDYPGNHYSLLEVVDPQPLDMPHRTFVFNDDEFSIPEQQDIVICDVPNNGETDNTQLNPSVESKFELDTTIEDGLSPPPTFNDGEKKTMITLDDKIPRKKNKDNKQQKLPSNDIRKDQLIIDYEKEGFIRPPKFITIPKQAIMIATCDIPEDRQYVSFIVTDNEGKGNCFYESICDSAVFVRSYPQYENKHQALRQTIFQHSKDNVKLTEEIFQLLLGMEEKIDWAGELLRETVRNESFKVGTKYLRILCQNAELRKKYRVPKQPMKKIRNVLRKLLDKNDTILHELVSTYCCNEDICEMADTWWKTNIGKDLFWAGMGEMVLFAHKFQMQLVVVRYREREIKGQTMHDVDLQPSFSVLKLFEHPSIVPDLYPDRTRLEETIFIWAVDPTNPWAPVLGSNEPRHYLSLNVAWVDMLELPDIDVLQLEHND
jgi:hypothetical protein